MHPTDARYNDVAGPAARQLRFIEDVVVRSGRDVVDQWDDVMAAHGGDTTKVAKQLFETDSPSAAEVAKVEDLAKAYEGIRAVCEAAGGSEVAANSARPGDMRRMRAPV